VEEAPCVSEKKEIPAAEAEQGETPLLSAAAAAVVAYLPRIVAAIRGWEIDLKRVWKQLEKRKEEEQGEH
jgi:hypothetical protein